MLLSLQATVFAAESDTPEVGEVVDLGDGKTMVVLENKPDTYTIATGEDLENGNAIFRIITNGEIISEYYTDRNSLQITRTSNISNNDSADVKIIHKLPENNTEIVPMAEYYVGTIWYDYVNGSTAGTCGARIYREFTYKNSSLYS